MRADALRRRLTIIETAKRFLLGQRNIVLEKVADESNVGIATLYRNFPNRQELINEAVLSLVRDGIEQFNEISRVLDSNTSHNEYVSQLHKVIHLSNTIGVHVFGPMVVEEQPDRLTEELAQAREEGLRVMREVFNQFVKKGLIHESISTSEFYNGVIALSYQPQFGTTDNRATTNERLIEIFLAGCKHGT